MAARKGLEVIAAEYKATDKVPEAARTFGFWDQFALWFAAASLPAAWLYGGYMTGAFGLAGAIVLIFAVSTLSFIPWALLGYIAADKGASSVGLLRPSFGLRGSKLPSVFYLFFGYGWATVNVFIAAISMSFIFQATFGWPNAFETPPGAPVNYFMIPSILLICFLQGFFATAGHRAIRFLNWGSTIALVVFGAYETYIVLRAADLGQLLAWRPAQPLSFTLSGGVLGGGFTYTLTFALLVDLLIAYNWTWEFIGDFSRFARSKRAGTWGPFGGASLAQYWFFMVGAILTVSALSVDPTQSFAVVSEPSATATRLGFGVGAYLVILFATIATNAGNIYASGLGISNLFPKGSWTLRRLLLLSAIVVVPLSLLPLLAPNFVFTYIFFLDVLGAIVVPLWTLVLVDYFLVKGKRYHDDMFRIEGGQYWYRGGWNWPAVATLLAGTSIYWVVAFGFPAVRETVSAALPTIAFVGLVYYLWGRAAWTRHLQALREARLVESAASGNSPG
ncbi:MAG: purine-cytosine permease family protein [Methanobacteriota archaeon]